jgi:hypothetical protein
MLGKHESTLSSSLQPPTFEPLAREAYSTRFPCTRFEHADLTFSRSPSLADSLYLSLSPSHPPSRARALSLPPSVALCISLSLSRSLQHPLLASFGVG